jgi:uncharacterized protein
MAQADPSNRLREAIIANDISLVERFLKARPWLLQNPDFEDKSNTSLHLAAIYGHKEIAELLISLGHDRSPDEDPQYHIYSARTDNLGISVNHDGHSPLHLAAIYSREPLVELLCSQFPHTVNRRDYEGRTPLHLASSAHVMPLTAIVQSAKNSRPMEDLTIIETLIRYGGEVNAQDNAGNTCLHNATAWGHLKAVRALIQAGADPLCSNFAGWAPHNYSLTVQADVYYRNLVAEWEKRKAEEKLHQSERRGKGGGAVRLVSDHDDDSEIDQRSRSGSARSQATNEAEPGLGISVG